MKLREVNKEHNRRFHELSGADRLEFLNESYEQVFATSDEQRGEFTPLAIVPEQLTQNPSREDKAALADSAHKLNFLMTRYNMEGQPEFEDRVRELALLRFEYVFLAGDTDVTHDPQLVADFFTKRGKPELITPVLARMGEQAIDYEHLAERVIEHPIFEEYLGSETTVYKFRTRMHALVNDEDYDKEQTAKTLMAEGFDLLACDFNRWFATESDWSIRRGDSLFEPSAKDTAWLEQFVSRTSAAEEESPTPSEQTAIVQADYEDEPESEFECSKKTLEKLDANIQRVVAEKGDDPKFYWVKALAPLTADHEALTLDSKNAVEVKMWDRLWGGDFIDLAYILKGANPTGRTRNGLSYNHWALMHEEHSKGISPILAQNSYAMIIAGDLLVGDLDTAIKNLNDTRLQEFKNSEKIGAAVNLAWEKLQHPGESDEAEDFEPSRAYLFRIAEEFGEYLQDTPSAQPYLRLSSAPSGISLGNEEETILTDITNLEAVERIYTGLGWEDRIRERFLQIFDEIYDDDTEYISLHSEVRGVVSVIQDETFRKYISDEAIGERLHSGIQRTLERRRRYNPEERESGAEKLVLTMYQNSLLQPYLAGRVDIGQMLNGMIDDVVGHKNELLTEPCSLMHQGELEFMGPSEVIEAYMLADSLREHVDPKRMGKLVAYLLTLNSEMGAGNSISLTNLLIDKVGEQADPSYQRPNYFPDPERDRDDQKIEFLSNVLQREKELGGLDWEAASIGVTNVIFRGTYVQPTRFFPRLDTVLGFLDSPLAELIPTEGLADDAVKEFRILNEFLKK